MQRRSAVTAACATAVAALAVAGPGQAGPAHAATGAVQVPCRPQALAAALSGVSSGATLNLASQCTYRLTQGLPAVSHDLTINGRGATLERSYAGGTAPFTILTVDSGAVVISQLSFRNGRGAITDTGTGLLTVTGGTFRGNSAADGGAIYLDNAINGPQLTGVTFSGNSAADSGGAVNVNAASADPSIDHCVFIGNTAGDAGGAFSEYGFLGWLTADTFRGNTAQTGGAMAISNDDGESLSDVVVSGNSATLDGGGIYDTGDVGLFLNDSTVAGNHAGGRGGGVYNSRGSEVRSSLITGNRAADGGGYYNGRVGSVSFTASRVSGNHATADGGGIYNSSPSPLSDAFGSVALSHTTIADNSAAASGGGLYNQGEADLDGSQVVRNRAPGGGGGIYDDVLDQFTGVTVKNSTVRGNQPDNCEPPGTISGCTG